MHTPLNDAQIFHYRELGYVVAAGLADAACCEAVAATYEARRDQRLSDQTWTSTIFDRDQPNDPDIHQLLVDPRVVGAAAQLFGEEPRIFYGMLAAVPAGGGRGLPWHQDAMYSEVQGMALNIFTALRDIAPEQCMLWIAPRSHRAGVLPSTFRADGHHQANADPVGVIRLPAMRQGDTCIFDRYTLHRSLTNETRYTRYAYAAQFMAGSATEGGVKPSWPMASELAERFARMT